MKLIEFTALAVLSSPGLCNPASIAKDGKAMLGKSTAVQALSKLQLSQEIVHHFGDLALGAKAQGPTTP